MARGTTGLYRTFYCFFCLQHLSKWTASESNCLFFIRMPCYYTEQHPSPTCPACKPEEPGLAARLDDMSYLPTAEESEALAGSDARPRLSQICLRPSLLRVPPLLPCPCLPLQGTAWHQNTARRVHLGRQPALGPWLPLPVRRKKREAFLPHPRGEQPLRCPFCEPVRHGALHIRGRQGGACAHGCRFPPPGQWPLPREGWLPPPSPALSGCAPTPALPPFHSL